MDAAAGSGEFSAATDAVDNQGADPFVSTPSPAAPTHHRFSNFDSQLFALGPDASPAQAKKALEAHLAETDRRMEEAGKLGTALVQQRAELVERLKDVEQLQAEGGISQDLRQKLVEIEKDYNEVARESARAFLPKPRVPSNEVAGSPFVPEGKGGRRSVSPSKFEAQATGSPTKLSVPNRKLRNQPQNRIHDIEFAAEISTSLIAQVRNLQALLSEREEELRETKMEKSKLEYEAEGFQQRVKTMDESEHRYKDENWNLETQIHELIQAQKEAADREKKLTQSLNLLQAEKNSTQRELDEVKLSHSKLTEEHTAVIKQHDIELGTAKRSIRMSEDDRSALQKKLDDLTGQNQELAKAVSSQRGRKPGQDTFLSMSDDDFETANDTNTPEHSPPPSPIKGTPRHSMLESETLKTSLAHAQRMVQSMRNTVHREKTEKVELRRMLQDAREELEKLRGDPMATTKRARKVESKEFKKPPRLLGGLRTSRSEIYSEDPEWEDQMDTGSPSVNVPKLELSGENSDEFGTANEQEASDAAFETANERGTETDDFHTGAEEFSSSEDAQTETDSPTKTRKTRPPSLAMGLTRSGSVHSTASTEDELYEPDAKTPTTGIPILQPRFPLRVSRGANRRSRQPSEEPMFQSSPVSLAPSSAAGTPQQPGQSLAAELGDFDGSDNDSNLSATPSRRSLRSMTPGSIRGRTTSPPPAVPPLPKVVMVDSGMMTDPALNMQLLSPMGTPDLGRPLSVNTVVSQQSDASFEMQDNLAKFPSPPSSPPRRDYVAPEVAAAHAAEVENIRAAHVTELENLKAEHAQQLQELHEDNDTAHSNVLEAVRSEHGRQLVDAREAHSRAIDDLKASHSEQLRQSQELHSRELEELKSKHAEELSQRAAALESLKSKHEDESSKAIAAAEAAHVEAMASLKASHEEENRQLQSDGEARHLQELQALTAGHGEQLAQKESEIRAAHATEVENLKADHGDRFDIAKKEAEAALAAALATAAFTHSQELTALKGSHDKEVAGAREESDATRQRQLDDLEATLSNSHANELETLKANHAELLTATKKASDLAHAEELEKLKTSHIQQLEDAKKNLAMSHSQDTESLKAAHARELEEATAAHKAAHAEATAALSTSHEQALDSAKSAAEATLSRELAALKDSHATEIDTLKSEHAAAHAQELESFKAALAKQVESSQAEGDAAHNAQLEALNAANAEIIDAHKRESEKALSQALDTLKASHEKELDALASDNKSARAKDIDMLKTSHASEIEALKAGHSQLLQAAATEATTTKAAALAELTATHEAAIVALQDEHRAAVAKALDEEKAASAKALDDQSAAHADQLESTRKQHELAKAQELEALYSDHANSLTAMRGQHEDLRTKDVDELKANHTATLDALRVEHSKALEAALNNLKAEHAKTVDTLSNQHSSKQAEALRTLQSTHATQLDNLKSDHDAALSTSAAQLAQLKSDHDAALASHAVQLDQIKRDHDAALTNRGTQLDQLQSEHDAALASHAAQLDQLKRDYDAAVARTAETAQGDYVRKLQELTAASLAEREELIANHAIQIDDLRQSLASTPQALGISRVSSVETKPSDLPSLEDNSQRGSPAQNQIIPTYDQGVQTLLNTNGMDRLMRNQRRMSNESFTISTARGEVTVTPYDTALNSQPGSPNTVRRRSQDSIGSVTRARARMGEAAAMATLDQTPPRRPGSSASTRNAQQNMPPLPANHREAIEAARAVSSSGGRGTMGPPLLPASAYKSPSTSRPQTPSRMASGRGTPTPRANRAGGFPELGSPTRLTARSRQSSISSFTSEVETRFNMREHMALDAAGFEPGTDPRMIQAITQTMIGEYLWKYTRKAGRGEMSENRHRRYFWVHPYTRTLYWSDRDPSTAGRAELRAKSVPIEAVRVVADDNPMPPGLHRKSLVVVSPGRTVKFTCTTGQRHETWFNALSYLLLRTGNEAQNDVDALAGDITQEDVDEFNPSVNRPTAGSTRRGPPSLSSYNSRTTRNEAPAMDAAAMSIPTLTPSNDRGPNRSSGTLTRISGYWRSSTIGGTFNSLRRRSQTVHGGAIYEASEVNDSAEELRRIIEQQDRDADRLENVRACCDGKHDVGTLHHHSKRGRHSHGHPGLSATATPMGSTRSRA